MPTCRSAILSGSLHAFLSTIPERKSARLSKIFCGKIGYSSYPCKALADSKIAKAAALRATEEPGDAQSQEEQDCAQAQLQELITQNNTFRAGVIKKFGTQGQTALPMVGQVSFIVFFVHQACRIWTEQA